MQVHAQYFLVTMTLICISILGLDNIDIDDHDRMWITNHPKPLHFLAYMMNFAKQAPGRVWRQKSSVSCPGNGVS